MVFDLEKFKKDILAKKKTKEKEEKKAKKGKETQAALKSNPEAKKATEKLTKKAKNKGLDVIRKRLKKAIEEEKKAFMEKKVEFTVYGKEVLRKKINGKISFFESGTNKKIVNLYGWIQERAKDKQKQKVVKQNLKKYIDSIKGRNNEQRKKDIDALNKLNEKELQYGVKKIGEKIEDPIENAIKISKAVLKHKSGTTFKVTPALNKIRNNKFITYESTLPAYARVLTIKRGKDSYVVLRHTSSIKAFGRTVYRDLETGKPIYINAGDEISIVGVSDTKSEKYKKIQKRENGYKKALQDQGYVWEKNKDLPSKVGVKRGGYYAGAPSYAPSYTPSYNTGVSKTTPEAAEPAGPVEIPRGPHIEKTPEGWPSTLVVKNIELPTKRLYCTLVMPKRMPEGDERPIIVPFFSGKFRSNNYTPWRKDNIKPPSEVLTALTRKYLSSEHKKRVLDWQDQMAKQGKYVCLAFISEIHTKKENPGRDWYRELRMHKNSPKLFQEIFNRIRNGVAEATHSYPLPGFLITGHSMAGLPIMKMAEYMNKGLLNIDILGISNFDNTYWSVRPLCRLVKRSNIKMHTSFIRNTKTERRAQDIIRYFNLREKKHPSFGTVYLNPKYPNVIVREFRSNTVGHSEHPGKFIPESWEFIMGSSKQPKKKKA